ncbi:hypothetical protein AMJ40_01740, partial [candidate division TA06 bacterium DG_26]
AGCLTRDFSCISPPFSALLEQKTRRDRQHETSSLRVIDSVTIHLGSLRVRKSIEPTCYSDCILTMAERSYPVKSCPMSRLFSSTSSREVRRSAPPA